MTARPLRAVKRAASLLNSASKHKDWSCVPATHEARAQFVGLPSPARAATDKERGKGLAAVHQLRRVGHLPLDGRSRRAAAVIGPMSAVPWARSVRPFTRAEACGLQAAGCVVLTVGYCALWAKATRWTWTCAPRCAWAASLALRWRSRAPATWLPHSTRPRTMPSFAWGAGGPWP
eukprot:10343440-Alexandrium_andersonii.AAC.1